MTESEKYGVFVRSPRYSTACFLAFTTHNLSSGGRVCRDVCSRTITYCCTLSRVPHGMTMPRVPFGYPRKRPIRIRSRTPLPLAPAFFAPRQRHKSQLWGKTHPKRGVWYERLFFRKRVNSFSNLADIWWHRLVCRDTLH